MTEAEYYVVELFAETYNGETDGANKHTLGVPIVDGPFENQEDANPGGGYGTSTDGYAVVSVSKGVVPEDVLSDE